MAARGRTVRGAAKSGVPASSRPRGVPPPGARVPAPAERKGFERVYKDAQLSGKLSLSGRDLRDVPDVVCHLGEQNFEGVMGYEIQDLTSLKLDHNEIGVLPPALALLVTLRLLDVSHNKLVDLSAVDWSAFQQLEGADFSHNGIRALPPTLLECPYLRSLDVSHNRIDNLPGVSYSNLVEFKLNNNQLTTLPDSISTAVGIRSLSLQSNLLTMLPRGVAALDGLTELDASDNRLSALPDAICNLPLLAKLNVSRNRLAALPAALGRLRSLGELSACENALQAIPPEIAAGCASLQVLELRDNKILDIPVELAEMPRLHRLDLTNNELRNVPGELGYCESLNHLALRGNPLRTIRREILEKSTEAIKTYLRSRVAGPAAEEAAPAPLGGGSFERVREGRASGAVSLVGMRLTDIPASVFAGGAREVESLVLDNNSLDALPPTIGALRGLTAISVARNSLTRLPSELFDLPLTSLAVPYNKLAALPEEISFLARTLRKLDCEGNPGLRLPAAFAGLVRLTDLNLGGCRLDGIPDAVWNFQDLTSLALAGNRVRELSERAMDLTKLETLDLRNNDLKDIPNGLGFHPALRSLSLDGNPTRRLMRVLPRGTPAIMEYLRSVA